MGKGGVTVRMGMMMWTGLVRPVLEYGAEVWAGVNDYKWEDAEIEMRKWEREYWGVV